MAEAFLGIVAENLQSFVQEELATFWGVDSQIQKLSGNLTAIRAVLQDAEKQQITSKAVKDWLQKLSDAAHVLDDILDECSIQYSNRLLDEGNSGVAHKAHSLCLTPFNPKTILFRYDIGKRMQEVAKRFHDIDEERRKFELRTGVIERQQEDDEWRQTCSAITVDPQIYGRDQDKEKIVEFLLSNPSDSGDFSVYPIVGMGGLGKTTLVRWVFNDDRVIKHFDSKIWVCVSDNFDVMRILQAIIESTTGQNPNLSTLESMQKKVQEVLFGKSYLLVLDDVWNEDHQKWENLKSVLHCRGGTIAASVLVTTRLDSVASIMGPCQTHHLLPLSEGDNLSLFNYHAFGPNKEGRAELVAIGEEIVRKCAGSPLASKALGSLLRNKNEEKQWLAIKESKLWDIPQCDAIKCALRISYFNLKLPLRRCFSFCAIYPEDFEISKEQLIHLWMANNLIKSIGNMEVEDVGNEAWEELCQRSFFQEVKTDLFGNITFKIHDLFYGLAQSIMGEECKVSNSRALNNLASRVHHISCSDINRPLSLDMDAVEKFESLKTFIQLYWSPENFYGLKAFNFVRALRTSSSQLSALKSLTHLRYLNIYASDITTLPEGVSRLPKLQILKLECCAYLSCLPKHLTQLKDLRHLLIEGCSSLAEMPPNIGALKCLKTLSVFIVDSKTGYGLAELRDLKLGGKLHIKSLQNVLSESDARSASLISKKDLNRLYLSWDYNSNSDCTANVEPERILEALEPHPNLKSFGMKGYRGTQFPCWMINTSILSGLVCVILYDCKNCEQLPPLGKLPHLATLTVSGMSNVKYLDDDSYDGLVEEKAFKSLKKLTLLGLPNLERMLRDETVEMLPHLSELRVSCVPKLRLPLLQSVEHLCIEGPEPDLNYDGDEEDMGSFQEPIVQYMPHVKFLTIWGFPKLKVLPDELGSLSSLRKLEIVNCDELESFSESVLQGLNSLQTLGIYWCKKLKSFSDGVGHLTCLERLKIIGCPELVTLPNNMNQLTALRHVYISFNLTIAEGLQRIPSLQRLTLRNVEVDSLPEWLAGMASLQQLGIDYCPKLRSLPEWLGDMASLQQLDIGYCPKLRSLPSSFRRLTNMRELHIEDCPKLEKRCKRGTGEDWQNIAHIPQIEITPIAQKATFCKKIQRKWNMRKMKRDRSPPHYSEFDSMVDGA